MEADKIDDEWKLRKKVLNASNRNQLCLELAILLFVMMSSVYRITAVVFLGKTNLHLNSGAGSLLLSIVDLSATLFRVEEKRLRTKFLNCICKLRRKCQKSMSDKAAFQFDVDLKEIESIFSAYNRKGFLDQLMESHKLRRYFLKIQSTLTKFESMMNPSEIREWRNVTGKLYELMQNRLNKFMFGDIATISHQYFCRKTGIADN